jgi:hypothetical protein
VNTETFDRTVSLVYTVAYCVAVAAMVLLLVPPLRLRLQLEAGRAGQTWRYGRWLERRTPPPGMLRHLDRADLPDEVV